MKQTFRIRTTLSFALLFCLVSMMSTIVAYQLNRKNVEQALKSRYETVLQLIAQGISDDIERLRNLCTLIASYPMTNRLIKHMYYQDSMHLSQAEGGDLQLSTKNFINGLLLYDPFLENVGIMVEGNKYYHYANNATTPPLGFENEVIQMTWYQQARATQTPCLLGYHDSFLNQWTDTSLRPDSKRYFSIAQSVRNFTTGEAYGVVICSFNASAMTEKYLKSLETDSLEFYLIKNLTDDILLSSLSQMPANLAENSPIQDFVQTGGDAQLFNYKGRRCLAVRTPADQIDCKVVMVVSAIEGIYRPVNQLLMVSIVITAAGILVFLLLSYVYSRRLILPVSQIVSTLRLVGRGDLGIKIDLSEQQDELAYISQHINHLILRIKKLLEQVRKEETAARLAQMEALQMQINPHFICNTLGSIRLKALLDDQEELAEILGSFCSVLTRTFKSKGYFTTLREDIELIRSYEQIMRMRYGGTFYIAYHIDSNTESCYILKFLLQPTVENAILHGLLPLGAGGRIDIRATLDDKNLLLSVSDNGVGTEKKLHMPSVFEEKSEEGMMRSIGFSNLYNRLQLIYKGRAEIHFESAVGKGTTVRVLLPMDFTPPDIEV